MILVYERCCDLAVCMRDTVMLLCVSKMLFLTQFVEVKVGWAWCLPVLLLCTPPAVELEPSGSWREGRGKEYVCV